MPRQAGDRPDGVPAGAVNFAFLGQFAKTERDTVFTTEYPIRTGMEAVYTLLNVERGVPEVWGGVYAVRDLLKASARLRDGRKLAEIDLGLKGKMAMKEAMKIVGGTEVEKLLRDCDLIPLLNRQIFFSVPRSRKSLSGFGKFFVRFAQNNKGPTAVLLIKACGTTKKSCFLAFTYYGKLKVGTKKCTLFFKRNRLF